MEVYRLALFFGDLAWYDAVKLAQGAPTRALSDQLLRAAGGVSANIAEGYSRNSGKDQARFYEYALGSTRESRDWHYKARHVLGPAVTDHRLNLAAQISRHLLRLIPTVRPTTIAETREPYIIEEESTALTDLLEHVPMVQ
jgi:four helix bundle protein